MAVHEAVTRPAGPAAKLPPGQRRIEGFPRFGTELRRPPPPVPTDPVIRVSGTVTEAFDVPLGALATLPRRGLTADFHCVAGWTATDVHWEGVPFEAFYHGVIEPALEPGAEITHVVFRGLDRYRSVLLFEDAMADGVLIADQLGGRPLDGDHGAPVRLVSPAQYGYMSTKHLCRVEVHTGEPKPERWTLVESWLLRSHPRARVAQEERHGLVPGRLVRPVYAALKTPLLALSARERRARDAHAPMIVGEATTTVRASPNEVFDFVIDLERYRQADHKIGRVADVRRDGDRGTVQFSGRIRGLPGPSGTYPFTLDESRLVFGTPIAGPARWFLAAFEGSFDCEATPEGTQVTHREAYRFRAPWRWLAEPLLRRWLERDTADEMVRFKALVDATT